MLDNCGDSVGFPEAEDDAPCVDQGRLAGLFLRLHARRFSGLAYVSADTRTLTFAFRDGTVVLIEEPSTESSLADSLVERGLLSRDDYAEVIAKVTEELVDNEEVAFCQHAVSLGFLTEEQVSAELSERVRSKLIQSLSLVDCQFELDEDPDSLSTLTGEYPQKLGAAIYMGVRTFYEEEVLRGYVPDLKRSYMRLLKPPAEIARFFELDYEEVALLNAVDPQTRAHTWFARSDLEEGHALQLLALLLIGRMCEFSNSAFAPPDAERSGVRTAAARPESNRNLSRAAMPAVREEVFEPRGTSRSGVPAVQAPLRPESGRLAPTGASLPDDNRSPALRGGSGRLTGALDPRVEPGSTPASARREGSGAHASPLISRREGSGAHASPLITRRDGSGAHSAPAAPPSVVPAPPRPNSTVPEMPATFPVDAAAEALAEARARAKARDGKRTGSYAALRLGREIAEQRKPASSTSSAATPVARQDSKEVLPPARPKPNPAVPARQVSAPLQPESAPEYQKAHLKELMQRRLGAAAPAADAGGAPRKDPARELRHAQDLLRDGQYARAEEVLRGLVEQTPNNDTVRAYHMWAQLRSSHSLDPSQLVTLRDLAKKMVSDQEHAGFGCYVLAHLYLADKKDEQAEKYFRKAHQLDKNNKDAERHVVILERRKSQGAEGDAAGQRKIFGISFNKPKE